MYATDWIEYLPMLERWHVDLLVPGSSGDHEDFQAMRRAGFTLEKGFEGLFIKGPFHKNDLTDIVARRAKLREQRAEVQTTLKRIEAELAKIGG